MITRPERTDFEPFGEHLGASPGDPIAMPRGASHLITRAGIVVFWSLVVVIIAARAALFDPTIFGSFAQIAAIF